jgi:drug/metabolite transporter (DMT)-like permease
MHHPLRAKATGLLVLATLFWGFSFPLMKALGLLVHGLLPQASSWFVASSAMVVRFGVAAVLILVWSARTLARLTWLETWQGLGLGLFSGIGMVLQMDGLAYTSASTSAFLTQSYCVALPGLAALRDRRWPSWLLAVCSCLVMCGVMKLAHLDWNHLQIGRGEVETLLSSAVFAVQILWLERPLFAGNRVRHFSLIMFAMMSLVSLPVALGSMRAGADWSVLYTCKPVIGIMATLVVFCTLIAFVLMNRWQPVLPAPEAALIYAAEPVFASLAALFLPAWLSAAAAIEYENERATWDLIVGGGLITLANLLIQLPALFTPGPAAVNPGRTKPPHARL